MLGEESQGNATDTGGHEYREREREDISEEPKERERRERYSEERTDRRTEDESRKKRIFKDMISFTVCNHFEFTLTF